MKDERIADVGEFGLIARIDDLLKREGRAAERVTLGIGDDTASFLPRPGTEILVTCDSMVEGRHYLRQHIRPRDLGRRAMAMNISDIGAMAGRPLYALISLGLQPDLFVAEVEEIYRGFLAELNPFEACIIGGNITKSGNGMFIDITLIGEVEEGGKVRRAGARPGDSILVTGYPGQAAAGLRLLLRASEDPRILEDPLVKIYNTPAHRARLGEAVAKSKLATAMIDTSDGFAGDLGHICGESGVGAEIFQAKIPLNEDLLRAAAALGEEPHNFFLGDSDDYELVITCAPQDVGALRSLISETHGIPAAEVGIITDRTREMVLGSPEGKRRPLKPASWDHFRGSKGD
jgi:thiamine-monophosphate kinase